VRMPDGINLLSQLMREDTSVQGGPKAAKADSLAPLPPPVHPRASAGGSGKNHAVTYV